MMLRTITVSGLATMVGLWGCGSNKAGASKAASPATVAKAGDEAKLATIVLTSEANQRLGIQAVAVELRHVARRRRLGGEALIPPGRTIVVSAPLGGTLGPPPRGEFPKPGMHVSLGQPLASFVPLLSPERAVLTPSERVRLAEAQAALMTSQIGAAQQVESAEVQIAAAKIALARAEQLLRDRAGSQRSVDEAQAQLDLAEKTLNGARARHEFLAKATLDAEEGTLNPLPIDAPASGVLRRVEGVPGEMMSAGAPLFEIIAIDRLWIRVPVLVGQSREVDTDHNAEVTEFGAQADIKPILAKPVIAPPSADPITSTVDLFFEVANKDGLLRPGQRVSVMLALRGQAESLVVPWSAVVYDIHGGTWVYEVVAELTYVRRRVTMRFLDDSWAVLESGPKPGAMVVTEGVAELFGTEFGAGK